MSIRFSVKRVATVAISKTYGGDVSGYVLRQATTRLFTAFRQIESMRDRHNEQGSTNITNDDRSTNSYVPDKAKEGVKKATDAALNAGDNMKNAMDGAWKAAKGNGSKHQRSNSGG
ncbi:hypothetical protein Bca52824_085952 [Brassica carinata]|uniref:Uncharacterized protein n=1 Tax=Brassica carinata TaxID=52824 RepID=A0A8X7PAP8_BRACI|nr:hypothetical protein Bca52824_085952 [Brassica carinata]